MKADIVIIGSGISGLTAAAVLAANGKKVVVIEKKSRVGGALKRFHRNGIPFDVGFHYTGCLGEGQILSRLWEYCGVLRRLKILKFSPEGHDRISLDEYDRPIRAFFNQADFIEELRRHFPSEKQAIRHYFDKINIVCKAIPFYNHALALTDFLQGYRPPGKSLAAFLRSLTDNPFLQSALAVPAILYGIPTDRVSVEVHAMVAYSYHTGAYSIAGGGQAIADAFQDRLQEVGAQVLTGCTATSLLVQDHGVTGVQTDCRDIIAAPRVIYTGHPASFIDIVPETCFRPAFRKRLLQLKNSLSMFIVFGTVAATATTEEFLNWTNHIHTQRGPNPFPPSPETVPEHRTMMLTCTERGSNTALPPQVKNVILLQPAFWEEVENFQHCRKGKRPAAYTDFKQSVTERMLRTAERKWGDSIGRITPLATGTPLTLRDELSAPEGCAYGAMHSLDQFTPGTRTRIPGLFLSGQSSLMTGIVGASISGMVGAGEILGLETLWREIVRWS